MEFRKALSELRAIWVLGNTYLTNAEPWTHFKTNRDRAAVGVRTGINLIALFARLSSPVIPDLSNSMLKSLGLGEGDLSNKNLAWPDPPADAWLQALKPGHPLQPPEILVRKIEDSEVSAWQTQFGGVPENS